MSFHIHPFNAPLNVADVPDEVQDEFTELRNDSTAHDLLQENALLSLQVLVPFASTPGEGG